ncbi:peptidase M23-like protein [Tumebacillus sp. BK434]|uniref:M23 family metallopeptidase n=1 Tax=Tumebacillus sp. BK434 TaxID=2512169 RepID=UPI001049CD25|nr:M23 family metallopeptidase [Tumebacillus sp. BK434]TCP52196.1 peptidase M23-like protein [Tumebacillus sp. BK434]
MFGPYDLLAPWPAGVCYTCIKGNFEDTHNMPFTYFAWDFDMPVGSAVIAASGGVVAVTGYTGTDGYGNQVRIRHRDGSYTLYGHLSAHDVQVGQQVQRGQLIGASGHTGYSFSPHLHFSVVDRNNYSYPSFFCDIGNPVNGQRCRSQNAPRRL